MRKIILLAVLAAVVAAGCVGQSQSGPSGAVIAVQPLKLSVSFEDVSAGGSCAVVARYDVMNNGKAIAEGVSVQFMAQNPDTGEIQYRNTMSLGSVKPGFATNLLTENVPYPCDGSSLLVTATAYDAVGHADSVSWAK